MAASEAAAELVYIRRLLRELGEVMDTPTKLHVDNSGAVELSKDRKSCHRSRHILRRYFYVREAAAMGEVQVLKVDTKLNQSDVLTKNTFDIPTFREFKCQLMGADVKEAAAADETPPRKRKGHEPINDASLRASLVYARAYAMSDCPALFAT